LGIRKGIRPEKNEWWGAGVVVCLERGADLHMAQLMPLPLTVSCFSKIQIGFTFLVPAHPVVPEKKPLNGVCVCVVYQSTERKFKQISITLNVLFQSELHYKPHCNKSFIQQTDILIKNVMIKTTN